MNKMFCIFLLLSFIACKMEKVIPKPTRWLGDISFDKKLDRENFIICNGEENIFQYFNLGDNIEIEGDKPYILAHFKSGYVVENISKESGLIRIRFIVNCHGETDRFRILESNLNYKPKKFHKSIVNKLLELTKSLEGWKHKFKDGKAVDYYQYLVFKIENGRIIKILP